MKILLIQNLVYIPSYGGANKCDRLLLEKLTERGHVCCVVAPAIGGQSLETRTSFLDKLTDLGIRTTSYPNVEVFFLNGVEVYAVTNPAQLRAYVIRQILTFEPTWILVSSEDPGQILLEAAIRTHGSRVVYLAHTTQMLPFGPRCFIPGSNKTLLLQQTSGIITVSNYLREHIRRWGGLESIVMRFPIYGTGTYPSFGCFDKGCVTLINPCAYKGITIFLALARALPHVPFAAVPTWGTTQADRQALKQLPNVRIIEPVDDIDAIFEQSRILLVPSLWDEAFGLVATEAMLRGIPVLASNVGALPEAKLGIDYVLPVCPITHYENRMDDRMNPYGVIPDQNITPWLKTLQELLSNRKSYYQLSKTSRNAALTFVSGAKITLFEDFLENLIPATIIRHSSDPIPAKVDDLGTDDTFDSLSRLSPEKLALLALRLRKKRFKV